MLVVDLGGPGVMTSKIGQIYQQTICCSRQSIAEHQRIGRAPTYNDDVETVIKDSSTP